MHLWIHLNVCAEATLPRATRSQWQGTVRTLVLHVECEMPPIGWKMPHRPSWNFHRLVLKSEPPPTQSPSFPSPITGVKPASQSEGSPWPLLLPLLYPFTDKYLGPALVLPLGGLELSPVDHKLTKRVGGEMGTSDCGWLRACILIGVWTQVVPGAMWQPSCWKLHCWRCRKKSWILLWGNFKRQVPKYGAWQYSKCEDSN